MADQTLTTNRRRMLAGMIAAIPVAGAVAAPAARETPVARAYAALLLAEQRALADGDSMHAEEVAFWEAIPETFEDVRMKATWAHARMKSYCNGYWHAAKLISDLAVAA